MTDHRRTTDAPTDRLTRRSILRGVAATGSAAAMAGAAPAAAATTLEDENFEETDWGYRRRDFQFDDSREWPTLMIYDGYGGASDPSPNAYLRMSDGVLVALHVSYDHGPDGNYARVRASIRGTECSGGNFNLYDRRHAWDGHEIIEWVAAQAWSNGRVGMYGCSFYGQTPFWTATTKPPHLEALMIGGLHSDIYRDLVYIGGVQNNVFPVAWYFEGPNRLPESAGRNGTIPEDRICTEHQATRYDRKNRPSTTEYLTNFLDPTYGDWWHAHAAMTYIDDIEVPYYQWVNWQDEQVGCRAAVLYEHVDPEPRTVRVPAGNGAGYKKETVVPKKLVTTSGDHCSGGYDDRDLWDWMDIWLRDEPDRAGLLDHHVENYFESRMDTASPEYTTVKRGDEFPFADTEWTRLHLREAGELTSDAPTGPEATDTYLSGVPKDNWFWYAPTAGSEAREVQGLPDGLGYETAPLDEDLVVAGPAMFDLYAELAGTDTDFFVSVNDVYPDGRISYVQRGMLKASMRAVNEDRSYYQDGVMYRPWYPFSNPTDVTPGEVVRYRVEVMPFGHIFRKGHRLRIQLHTPPAVDGLWGYSPHERDPAAVTVHHDADRPSSLLLPAVAPDEPVGPGPEGCGVPGGFPCDDATSLDGPTGE